MSLHDVDLYYFVPGTIYGFLFSSDIANNLLLGVMSSTILEKWGYTGFFLILSLFPIFALILTCFFPWDPSPNPGSVQIPADQEEFAQLEVIKERTENSADEENNQIPKTDVVSPTETSQKPETAEKV